MTGAVSAGKRAIPFFCAAQELGLRRVLGTHGGKKLASDAGSAGGRRVGERPFPERPEGADSLPQIDHLLVLMMENHSYDNYLGMLGRGPGESPRGDGLRSGRRAADGGQSCSRQRYPARLPDADHLPAVGQAIPGVGTGPCPVRCRPQRWIRAVGERPGRDGLLDRPGPAVGLLAGRHLPAGRSLVRLPLGPDPAEPPLPAGSHLGRHG